MTLLEVRSEQINDVWVATFLGEFDLANVELAERELRALEQRRPPVLLLDLSALAFLDSSGVRVILQADERARRDGWRLAILLGAGLPYRLFQILGLVERLDVVSDRADVLRS